MDVLHWAVNNLVIHYCYLQHPPKKERELLLLSTVFCESVGKKLSVCVFVCVHLQSIFSHNMPAVSNAHLILVKPCHGTPLSLSLSLSPCVCLCTITICILQKYCPCWPFPILPSSLCYFTSACSQSGWYGDYFVVWDVGKRMEGASVPPWEQAWETARWDTLSHERTHIHRNISRHGVVSL